MRHVVSISLLLFIFNSYACVAQERLAETANPSKSKYQAAASTPEATLRRMHDYLISAKDIEVTSNFSSVDKALGTTASGSVHYILRKPNLLRVTANLKRGKVVVFSDGELLNTSQSRPHANTADRRRPRTRWPVSTELPAFLACQRECSIFFGVSIISLRPTHRHRPNSPSLSPKK